MQSNVKSHFGAVDSRSFARLRHLKSQLEGKSIRAVELDVTKMGNAERARSRGK